MNNYKLKEKVNGWDYTTKAENFNQAVENIFLHLKSYKFTKQRIRELLEVQNG